MILEFNLTGIEEKVKPALAKSKKSLKSAKDIITSINIPKDFMHSGKLRNMTYDILDIKNDFNNIEKLLNELTNKFKNAENRNISLVNEIASDIGRINLTSTIKTAVREFNISLQEKVRAVIENYKDKLNNYWTEKVVAELMKDYANGKVDLDNISDEEFDKEIVNMIVKQGSMDEVFNFFASTSGKYGVDQGIFRGLSTTNLDEYKEVQTYLSENYNIDLRNSAMVMSALDSIGACSYADVANNIVGEFKDNPELFEKLFGFPLYKQTEGGWVLNDAKLLVDLYVFANKEENGGKLLIKDGDNYIVNIDAVNIKEDDPTRTALKSGSYQQYMSSSNEMNTKVINKYLASKTTNNEIKFVVDDLEISWDDVEIINDQWTAVTKLMSDEEINSLIVKVETAIRRRKTSKFRYLQKYC